MRHFICPKWHRVRVSNVTQKFRTTSIGTTLRNCFHIQLIYAPIMKPESVSDIPSLPPLIYLVIIFNYGLPYWSLNSKPTNRFLRFQRHRLANKWGRDVKNVVFACRNLQLVHDNTFKRTKNYVMSVPEWGIILLYVKRGGLLRYLSRWPFKLLN